MKATEMKTADWILEQLESEAPRTRRVLERVPEGRDDWKPHEKSMPLGRLAHLVATIPTWVGFIVNKDDLELNPPAGKSNVDQKPLRTPAELVAAHDKAVPMLIELHRCRGIAQRIEPKLGADNAVQHRGRMDRPIRAPRQIGTSARHRPGDQG